jgi:nucleoside-diphosphate-sugar epimerase
MKPSPIPLQPRPPGRLPPPLVRRPVPSCPSPLACLLLPPHQVVVLEGDLTLEGLGLSQEAAGALASEVTHVIHAASIIDLEADVRRTLQGNYCGTRRVLQLAARMRQLRGAVALSAAAANVNAPPGSSVDEAIYPLFFGSQEVGSQQPNTLCAAALLTASRLQIPALLLPSACMA